MESLKCVYKVQIVSKHEFREKLECFFAWNVLPQEKAVVKPLSPQWLHSFTYVI